MPRYKYAQYSLKQYGIYQTDSGTQTKLSGRWAFVRARFGIVKKGQAFWLYQHSPVTINGNHSRLRLKTNTGNSIITYHLVMKGNPFKLRIRTNCQSEWITQSQKIERKEEV